MSILPKHLQQRAIILANEPAWRKEDARTIIDYLSKNGYAVLGIELWIPEGDVPRVIGWSTYNIEFSGDWNNYVQLHAQFAMQDLMKVTTEGYLINLTWVDRNEVERE